MLVVFCSYCLVAPVDSISSHTRGRTLLITDLRVFYQPKSSPPFVIASIKSLAIRFLLAGQCPIRFFFILVHTFRSSPTLLFSLLHLFIP